MNYLPCFLWRYETNAYLCSRMIVGQSFGQVKQSKSFLFYEKFNLYGCHAFYMEHDSMYNK